MRHLHIKCTGLITLFLILSAGAIVAQQATLTFSPQWFPQAQFAGYYVAQDQNYYKEAGLNIKILHPSSTTSAFDYLFSGKTDIISSFLLDALKQKASGVPIVHVGQFSQHSALMIVAKKTSGVNQLKDLDNKKLGIWSYGFDDVPKAFLRQNNYKTRNIPVHNTVNLFLMDCIDAMIVMYYNEYDQIVNSGVNEDELNRFFFADYGFDIPEDGLFCLEKTYSQKKAAIDKFMKATLKGWEYASKNKEYALSLVVKEMDKAHLPNNKAHQQWMLDKVLETLESGNKNIQKGQLMEQDFYNAINVLRLSSPTSNLTFNFKLEDFSKASDVKSRK
jgi:NitT/TauT family transport system substrate-binding protein